MLPRTRSVWRRDPQPNASGEPGAVQLNAANNPTSWNAHDSLAEALEAMGDRAGAIEHYRRSRSLNPGNVNAVEHLKVLEAPSARLN